MKATSWLDPVPPFGWSLNKWLVVPSVVVCFTLNEIVLVAAMSKEVVRGTLMWSYWAPPTFPENCPTDSPVLTASSIILKVPPSETEAKILESSDSSKSIGKVCEYPKDTTNIANNNVIFFILKIFKIYKSQISSILTLTYSKLTHTKTIQS